MLTGLNRNSQIKQYISKVFCKETVDLAHAREHSFAMGLQTIAVPANVGKMLYLFCRLQQPKKILEIGTLGGYSTLWLAKGIAQGGLLISLESNEEHCRIAGEHVARADSSGRIEIRLGDASELLQKMIENKESPFDLIFIDADKKSYSSYFDLSMALSRSGTLILIDNLIPKRGEILEPDKRDAEAISIYAFNEQLAADSRVETMLFPTIVEDHGRIDALGVVLVR